MNTKNSRTCLFLRTVMCSGSQVLKALQAVSAWLIELIEDILKAWTKESATFGSSCSFADLSKKWMRSISHSFGSHLKLFLSERTVRGGIWEVRKGCAKRFLGGKKSTCSSLVREHRLHVHCCCRLDVVKGSTPSPLFLKGRQSPLCLPLLVFTW